MKAVITQLSTRPSYAKALHWAKLVSVTGSAQILVQAVGFISGILVIRLLPTQEYALYTLANTMLGTMVVLADGGITTGVMAQGGKVWQDRDRLGDVLVTGFALRKQFAVVSLGVSMPVLVYLLHHHGASWMTATLIVLALIPAFFTSLSGTLLEIAPKLHQRVIPLQRIQIGVALSRLLLLSLSIVAFPLTFIALLAAGLPQIWANRQIKKISSTFADSTRQPDFLIRKEILYMVRRLLPDSIYYCLSGQLTIWLISLYGSTAGVAQAGALGRLPVALTLFNVLFGSLILPRFSRLPIVSKIILKQYINIQIGLFVLAIFIILIIKLFSTEILSVLGPQYSGLQDELVIMMVGSVIGFIGGSSFFLCTCRGWIINPAISIPISIGAILIGIPLTDITSLEGIFFLNIFTSTIYMVMHLSYGLYKITKLKAILVYL